MQGNLVEGLDFHKFYFDFGADQQQSRSSFTNSSVKLTESKPAVRVMGTSAVVNYVRRIGSGETFEETRVWQLFSGQWRQVHFHRGPAPSE
jgi:Calcium/calmodulin dependent protein kinase II association domain